MSTNRGDFFQTLGVGTLGLTVGSVGLPLLVSCSDVNKKAVAEESGPVIQIGDKIAIVETTNGKVKGFILRDILYSQLPPQTVGFHQPSRSRRRKICCFGKCRYA